MLNALKGAVFVIEDTQAMGSTVSMWMSVDGLIALITQATITFVNVVNVATIRWVHTTALIVNIEVDASQICLIHAKQIAIIFMKDQAV